MEGKCYCCGKPGHKSPKCPHKERPREEWAIHKVKADEQAHAQAATEEQSTSKDSTSTLTTTQESKSSSGTKTGWAGCHVQFMHAQDMRKLILLDSESTTSVFCNPDYVENVQKLDDTLELHTNGGPMLTDEVCEVNKFGKSWFNEDSMTNIFSLAEMTDKYRVTFDSEKENAFIVHMKDKEIRFKRLPNGLYALNPAENAGATNTEVKAQFVTTLEENKKFFTPREFERAKKARDLYHAVGPPSIPDFRAALRMNLIRNNPVTNTDITLAEKIFGEDISSIKAKSTRSKPIPVVEDLIDIPSELISVQQDITLAMDGLQVNGLKFLTTISLNIYYRTANYLQTNNAENHERAINEVLAVYRQGGFQVSTIRCDNEFHAVMDPLAAQQTPPIAMNYANPQEHVPEAERNNRTIRERVRAAYHRLPYTHLPRIMVKYLVMEATRKLNLFPARHGVSKYYSPRMILHQQNIDYERHCRFTLGKARSRQKVNTPPCCTLTQLPPITPPQPASSVPYRCADTGCSEAHVLSNGLSDGGGSALCGERDE